MLRPLSLALLTLFLASALAVARAASSNPTDAAPLDLYNDALALLSQPESSLKTRSAAMSLLQQSAERGYAEAYNLLGFLYIEGNGLIRSPRKGNRMFELAAAANNPAGQYNLAYSYRFGRGVKRDLKKAEALLKQVVEPDQPHEILPESYALYRNLQGSAYYQLGGMHTSDGLLGKNFPQAIAYMKKAEALGIPDAAMFLAIQYALGKEVSKDSEQAESYLDRYNLLAQNQLRLSLSKTFYMGMDQDTDGYLDTLARSVADELDEEAARMKTAFGVSLMADPQAPIYDPTMAAKWLTLAKEESPPARVRLARLHYRGEGVDRDLVQARELLESSWKQNRMAAYNLAVMLAKGEGGDRDEARTASLLKEAASHGLFVAQRHLDNATPLEYLSFEHALEICRDAASKGDPRARYAYGLRLLDGIDIERNQAQARSSIEGAAKAGYAPAQFALATRFVGMFPANFAKKWVSESAKQGYLPARHQMAEWKLTGAFFKRNLSEAVAILRECVKAGHPQSHTTLALLYRNGIEVSKDPQRSLELLEAGVELGDPIAQMRLAEAYRDGIGVEKNIERAMEMLIQASENGSINAFFLVGELYADGSLGQANWEEAIDWYEKAAEYGHSAAFMRLGDCYKEGLGAAANRVLALQWYSQAAESVGNLDAQYEVAVLLALPGWSQSDPKQAAMILRNLEAQHYPPALFQLGELNAKGIGLPQNYKKALEKWSQASRYGPYNLYSELGDKIEKLYQKKSSKLYSFRYSKRAQDLLQKLAIEALYQIAELVLNGQGTPRDPELAAGLFSLAAKSEHAQAAYRLALLHKQGSGVPASETSSASWLKKAAELGHVEAMYTLGSKLLDEGQTDSELLEGRTYLIKASENGHPGASKRLRELEGDNRMPSEEQRPPEEAIPVSSRALQVS